MRFKFLGTAAAEAIPALWCSCDVCKQAVANGGKDIRRRASYLIDDDTLIDFGPDANWQRIAFNIDLTKIKRIIFTHPHEDHLDPVELFWRRNGFGKVDSKLDVYGSYHVACRIMEAAGSVSNCYSLDALKINFTELYHGAVIATDDGITLTALEAHHAPGKGALFYALQRNGKNILIANDTGMPFEHCWEILEKMKFDMVVSECTMGFQDSPWAGHLSVKTAEQFIARLREKGCLNDGCRIFVTHFSHNGGNLHDRLTAHFNPQGIEVAYDGLEAEV